MPVHRIVGSLGGSGWRPLRGAAAALDIGAATGPRYALKRLRGGASQSAREQRETSETYRRLWGEAAEELGARVEELGGDYLELALGGVRTRVWRQWTMLDDAVTLRLAHQKAITHELLSDAAVPVPAYERSHYRDLEPLRRLIEAGGEVVVKPASGTGSGSGVTGGVTSYEDLRRARARAARLSEELLVERRARGELYRLLFCDGELLGTLHRRVPSIEADGTATVLELIERENARRRSMVGGMVAHVDLDCLLALRRQGFELESVPERGRRVEIKSIASQNAFEENETVVRERLSDEVVETCARAVEAVGLRLGAVDLIAEDPSRPLEGAGAVVLEVNGTPGLHYHYLVREPAEASRVCIPILRRLLS